MCCNKKNLEKAILSFFSPTLKFDNFQDIRGDISSRAVGQTKANSTITQLGEGGVEWRPRRKWNGKTQNHLHRFALKWKKYFNNNENTRIASNGKYKSGLNQIKTKNHLHLPLQWKNSSTVNARQGLF